MSDPRKLIYRRLPGYIAAGQSAVTFFTATAEDWPSAAVMQRNAWAAWVPLHKCGGCQIGDVVHEKESGKNKGDYIYI